MTSWHWAPTVAPLPLLPLLLLSPPHPHDKIPRMTVPTPMKLRIVPASPISPIRRRTGTRRQSCSKKEERGLPSGFSF